MTDLETAKYYARRRIEKEQQMSEDMARAYIRAFNRVLTLSFASGVSPSMFAFSRHFELDEKVKTAINKLVADLYSIVEKYSFINLEYAKQKNKRDEDLDIVGYINRPIKGNDINGRLAEYGENAKLEFEAYVAAGLLLKKPTNAILNEFKTHFRQPYTSGLLREAWGLKGAQIASVRLLSKGISFGSGKYTSTFNSFARLGGATTDFGFNWADHQYMSRNGAIGYQVFRGSSYPCQICDDNTGFHIIGDISLPVHSRCMCYATPVYSL